MAQARRGQPVRREGPAEPRLRVAQVVPHVKSFIRGAALALAPSVANLDLVVRHNPLVEVSALLPPVAPVRRIQQYRWSHSGASQSWPANLHLVRCSAAYLRPDGANPRVGAHLGKRILALVRTGRLARPDLVHGHFLHPQGVAAAAAARHLEVPLVLTGHGFDVYDLPRRGAHWRSLVEDTLGQASAVTAVSERLAKALRDLGVPRRALHVIPNGFDPGLFYRTDKGTARRRAGLPADATVLLAVGNLVPVKGHAFLLAALAPVLRADARRVLVVVGDGPLASSLRRLATDLGVAAQVRFQGARPHEEIPAWMSAADLFVLPSHDEGGGVVVLEAMACGTPVVATSVGHVPQAVAPTAGRVVTVGDEAAFRDAVEDLLAHPMDRGAVAAAAADWTWTLNATRTLAVYQAVTEQ